MRGTAKMIAEMIVKWRPDLVFTHHGRAASNAQFMDKLKRHSIKTAVYLCDEPYESGETCRYSPSFDYVFTMDPETVEPHRLSRLNRTPTVFYMPPAVDTSFFKPTPYSKRSIPALFLGNASLEPRRRYLEPVNRMIDGVDIRFWGSVSKNHPKWVPLRKHPELYSRCLVGLNVHRSPWISKECFVGRVIGRPPSLKIPAGLDVKHQRPKEWGTGFWNDANLPAAHVNPRFMEMAACGTLVVNDDSRSELERLFPIAPRAESPEHFYELVRYYIDHRNEAEEIGQECFNLISRRHSYRHRAAEVLIRAGFKELGAEDLRSYLGAPQDYLSLQPCDLPKGTSSSEPTGPSERWSPQYGKSLIRKSGSLKEATSIDALPLW